MSFICPFLEDQNTVDRLPALVKYRLGNKLMSYEEIDVGILYNIFLFGRNGCFSGGGGQNFVTLKSEIFPFFLHVGN